MKWFFGFNEAATNWFADMVKVAVVTAAAHAPHLEPHCLYDGDADTDLTRWLRARGVRVQRTAVRFRDRLSAADVVARNKGTSYSPVAARGYYLCLAVPAAEAARGEGHVLFTDCDVMFTAPADFAAIRPALLAAAPEMADVRRPAPGNYGPGFNSGVMVMCVAGMSAKMPWIESVLEREGYFQFAQAKAIYDQGALNTAIPEGEWDRLPDSLNWRPAFGINPAASIVHWHGPKPRHVEQTIATGVASAPDEAMRALLEAAPASYRHYVEIFRAALRAS